MAPMVGAIETGKYCGKHNYEIYNYQKK